MTDTLVLQLLAWVDARPRTYRETMDAWRTSCPRMPIWEDATDGGLVEIADSEGAGFQASIVRLTARGRDLLAATRSPRTAAAAPTDVVSPKVRQRWRGSS